MAVSRRSWGAAIQLYGVGTTVDGGAATPLLAPGSVMSDGSGNFNFLPSAYSCTGVSDVYLTATGGNPSPSGANPNLALLVAIGPCSSLTANTFVSVNELTTVAAVYNLAPYMTSLTAVGSTPAHAAALDAAFSLAGQFVDPTTGLTPGKNVPAGMTVPAAELNTLANIMAACVNTTGGAAGDNTPCGTLFSLTTPSGQSAPSDSVGAFLNIAVNPTQNTVALTNLVTPAAPFQPQLASAPASYAVALQPAGVIFGVSSLSYAATPVNATTATQTLQLTNISNSLVALSLQIAGANPTDFIQTTNCPASLPKAGSCSVFVAFKPTAAGARAGVVAVSYSGITGSVALTGTGLNASTGPVTLSPTTLSFYERGIPQTVTVTNMSPDPLSIQSVNLSGAQWTQTNDCGSVLSGSSVCSIQITPIINAVGVFSGTLSLTDSDTTDAQTVSLSSSVAYTYVYDLSNYPSSGTNWLQIYGSGVPYMSFGYTFQEYYATLAGPNAGAFQQINYSCSTKTPGNYVHRGVHAHLRNGRERHSYRHRYRHGLHLHHLPERPGRRAGGWPVQFES